MEEQMISQRDARVDIMRVLGTFFVMLAHVSAPAVLQKIRGFDVVMLVFISGLSFSGKKITFYGAYLWQRFKKLVLPTYGIITCLFVGAFGVCTVMGREQLFSWNTVWRSYVFADGIGFIWIVKVYMLIAAVSPFLYQIAKQIKSDGLFCLLIAGAYGVYHILMLLLNGNAFLYQYVFQLFPYALIACIGMRARGNDTFRWKALIVATIIVITDVAVRGNFDFENFKYPPQYNYLAYGLFAALLLYRLLPNYANKGILWFSKNSFTVYLFHIIFLLATNFVAESKAFSFVGIWYVQFVLVVALSVAAAWMINQIGAKLPGKKGSCSK